MELQSLPKTQRELWVKLAGVKDIGNYYLAGGTAVALHLGHRESIDFDFFSSQLGITSSLVEQLTLLGRLIIDQHDEDTFLATLEGVSLSFFRYPYQLLTPAIDYNGILVAQLEDLVAMKIIAISQRGTKKDFIDLHGILNTGWNFEAVFDCVERKFKDVHYNKLHLLKSLTYFEDADLDQMPRMLKKLDWETIKSDIRSRVRQFVR